MNPGLLLYRSVLKLFALTLKGASPFNSKAKLFKEGRMHLFEEIRETIGSKIDTPRAWFHCASLGEFEQGRPLIEKFKEEYPTYEIFLSFFSPSGYEVRKHYPLADYVFYLPLDSAENARKFVDLVNPCISFFVKYEFWYFYLYELKKRDIPVFSISAIFRSDQLFFKSYGGFYRNILRFFDHIFVQDKNSKLLLQELGIENVSVSGDTRFDRVNALRTNFKKIPFVEEFKDQKPLLVVGSSWKDDLDVLIPFINMNKFGLKFIIAPHEIHEDNIKAIQLSLKKPNIRYSEAISLSDHSLSKYNVLIIDNIGLLSSLYHYGEYAYVGGAFGDGLHNILEPATFGIPVIFGDKNYAKFKEAKELLAAGGAFAIGNENELHHVFQMLSDKTLLQKAGKTSGDYVLKNIGATAQIIKHCKKVLDNQILKE